MKYPNVRLLQPHLLHAEENNVMTMQMEIDSKEVLSYDVLLDYVHPPSQIRDKGFAKPPGPPQRGTRRVTKAVV